jgi:hypothetical protein
MSNWLKEMGSKMYTEGWGPGSPNLPGDARTLYTPSETKDSVKMKGIFGAGDSPSNMLGMSQASGQNPFEQEEEEVISKTKLLQYVNQELEKLNPNNQLEKSAVLILTKLKEIVERA